MILINVYSYYKIYYRKGRRLDYLGTMKTVDGESLKDAEKRAYEQYKDLIKKED